MVKVDPFTKEIIRHRLAGVVDEGVITLENISGTIVSAEAHDVTVALFTPEGELIYYCVGLLQHLPCISQSVKSIINYFSSEELGIFEDDVFMLNDPFFGALHAPDVFIIRPIHFKGKLVAFVATFLHVTDLGSIDPGGFCPRATEWFHEGFQTRGLKLIEKGKLRKDVWDTIMNMSRLPEPVAMDYKTQIAAGYVAKQRMVKLYEDYGVDVVDAAARGLIDETEQLLRQRLLEIPDGVYRARKYYDQASGEVYRIEAAAIKEKDSLTFDFTGTDPQVNSSINCTYWAGFGGIFPAILTYLCWDMTWNEGILRVIKFTAPEGTLVNACFPAATSLASIGVMVVENQLSTALVSKMLGATEKYKSRAGGDWMGAFSVQLLAGVLPTGEFHVMLVPDPFIGAGGSRAYKDGVDTGGIIHAGMSGGPNVETTEARFPTLYLFMKQVPDSGGPGKYRGGCCYEAAKVPHGSPANKFDLLTMPGMGVLHPQSFGIFGGLPGCNVVLAQFRDANVSEFPADPSSIRSERVDYVSLGGTEIRANDILFERPAGSGGYGDPLDRDPDLVLNDVLQGLVTMGPARDIYGVVIDLDNERIDVEATRGRRLELRKGRLGGRELEVDVSKGADIPPSGRRISEYLQLAGSGEESFVQCTWCGRKICPANVRWKDNVVTRKVPTSDAGPARESSLFFLREFFCPNCATQLDAEVIYNDDPPIYDDIYRWPE